MDFRSRGSQPNAPHTQQAVNTGAGSGSPLNKLNGSKGNWHDRGLGLMLLAGGLMLVALAFLIATGSPTQAQAVNDKNYQAVFLNNGQVYFGKIKNLNDKFVDLQQIYYLQTNGAQGEQAQTANSNVSLVKLGCELHAPSDQMLINYDQVIFWENIQDSSQVAKAINDYKKQNPNGQKCSTESQNSTQQAPSTNSPATGAQAPAAAAPAPAPAPAPTAPRRP